MKQSKSPLRKIILIASIPALIAAGYFLWQHYKYRLAESVAKAVITNKTDSLYNITYDSLHLDEANGNAHLKNVHVIPDTARIHLMSQEQMPPVMLEVFVKSITIRGINPEDALRGKAIIGDTVIIHHPQITMYTLKPLKKKTKLESEAKSVFREILGKLHRIHLKYILIDTINVSARNFFSGKKSFDFSNGSIQLTDVLVDSAHQEDTTRTMFCKNAAFAVDSFYSYNFNRPEFIIRKLAFSGDTHSFTFEKIILNRFNDAISAGEPLLDASGLKLSGINTDAIIKNKALTAEAIECREINFHEPPKENISDIGQKISEKPDVTDTVTGFRNVYSFHVQSIGFGNVNFIPKEKNQFDIGKIKLNIRGVSARKIANFESNPLRYIEEADLDIANIKLTSADKQYQFLFDGIHVNSLNKNIFIKSAFCNPLLGESSFANHYPFQKDRFEASLQELNINGIDVDDIFNHKLIADRLTIKNLSAKIYRDLNKPIEQKSKVGNYPSQMLETLSFPVQIGNAEVTNANIQYRERQASGKQTGNIGFYNTRMRISNITNIKSEIAKDNNLIVNFSSKVLNKIPLSGFFNFYLGKKDGAFDVHGEIGKFDATILNEISVPLAMLRIKKGIIEEIKFDFHGNDYKAGGPFVMKYNHMKVDVMKKDHLSDTIRRRGLISLLANIIVKNENPENGQLRKEIPSHERNIYKSFFNLIWKTLFAGIKITVGIP